MTLHLLGLSGSLATARPDPDSARRARCMLRAVALLVALAPLAAAQPADSLRVEVFVGAPQHNGRVTSTLVVGPTGVVVIDAQGVPSDALRLAARVLDTGLPLRAVFLTHAHPDHALGLASLLDVFPGTPVYAAPDVAAEYPRRVTLPDPGPNRATRVVTPAPYDAATFRLDGHAIDLHPAGQGDTDHSTWYHVPSAHAVVAGDLVYDGVPLYLLDVDAPGRRAWADGVRALRDAVSRQRVTRLVPGHGSDGARPEAGLAWTLAYLDAFDAAVRAAPSADAATADLGRRFGPAPYTAPAVARALGGR